MKMVLWIGLTLVVLVMGVLGLQRIASERVEVVVPIELQPLD